MRSSGEGEADRLKAQMTKRETFLMESCERRCELEKNTQDVEAAQSPFGSAEERAEVLPPLEAKTNMSRFTTGCNPSNQRDCRVSDPLKGLCPAHEKLLLSWIVSEQYFKLFTCLAQPQEVISPPKRAELHVLLNL